MKAAIILFGAWSLAGSAWADPRIQARGNPDEALLSVEGNERRYFFIHSKQVLETEILGPTSIVATFRVLFSSATADLVSYKIAVTMDNEATRKHGRETKRSDKVHFLEKHTSWIVGRSNKVSLQIPPGSHIVRWGPLADIKKQPLEALISILREKQKLPLTPSTYAWVTRDHYRSKDRTWYGVTMRRPVSLDVVGPTRLQVVSSLDFGPGMRGLQAYTLILEMDGRPVRNWTQKAEKSETWSYEDRPQIVPGNPNRFTIGVPKGKHLFRMLLANTLAPSACLRFLIPKEHALNAQE